VSDKELKNWEEIAFPWLDSYDKHEIPIGQQKEAFEQLVGLFVKYGYTQEDLTASVQGKIVDLTVRNTPKRREWEAVNRKFLKAAIYSYFAPPDFFENIPEPTYSEESERYLAAQEAKRAEYRRTEDDPEVPIKAADMSLVKEDQVGYSNWVSDEELDKELGVSK
jgi:hypothetical protein